MSDQPYCHYPQCGCPNKKSKSDCFKGYPLEGSMTAPSETPLTNGFPTRVVERAIQEALHPIGMSTHSGKVTLDISHVQRIIARSRQIETALAESRAECERLRKRLQWAANELLVCDYGDNQDMQQVGWIVCGWREQKKQIHEKRRIYGQSIEIAIDGEIP